ncbi:hypothetical protein MBLNU13_g01410t2 [Cladosporium sp. NU13]
MPQTMKESNGKAASQERDTRRPTRHEALLAQVEEIKATLYVSEKDTICPTRDEALRPQLEKIKATLEASSGDKEACTGEKSLFQVLKECIPDESLLKSFLDKRSRTTTRISLISNGGYARKSAHTPQDVWNVVDEKETSENHILIVRDIDSDWCEALCTQYPGSIDRRFILEQILGLDLQLFPGCLYQEIYNSKKLLKEDMDGTMNGRALIGQILANLQLLLDMPKPEIHETQTESTSDGRPTRHAFALTMHAFDGGFRDLISSWMGFFNENLNLTDRQVLHVNSLVHQHLLATAARIDSQTKKARGVHVNWWYESQAEDRGYHSSYISNHNEFKNKPELSAWAQSQADGLVFASLLKETAVRMCVEREEVEMRDLAYVADTGDGAEHFERLTNFRRVLTRLHRSIGEAQQAFRISAKAELHERGLVLLRASKPSKRPAALEPEGEMEDPTKSQGPADFTKLHTESLQGLQERLDAIKEDLNEEIQLAIGSVQVHDAQTMKKQTTWTVVLSVLAAIYLPMTLVTGIFGMNITEISAEPTAPDACLAKSPPDSLAVPGRADNTLVSRCSTPPSESHFAPPFQPQGPEVQASRDDATANVDESRPAERWIIDQLKEYIPKGSDSVLERVVHNRSSCAVVTLKSNGGSMKPDVWKPKAGWEQVDKLDHAEHGVLIIDDIDDEWCDELCKRYPKMISRSSFWSTY